MTCNTEDFSVSIPLEALSESHWSDSGIGNRITIIGSASQTADIITKRLHNEFDFVGLDIRPTCPQYFTETVLGSVTDKNLVQEVISGSNFVLYLATGVAKGWEGILDVEISGTKNVLEASLAAGVHRVIVASSLHSVGWNEREWLSDKSRKVIPPSATHRPDGFYGVGKGFVESLSRFASDWSGMGVSVLRIGTFRSNLTKDDLIESDELSYLGFGAKRIDRINRTWLTSEDMVRGVLEEIRSTEKYRLRCLTSAPDQSDWDHSVFLGDNFEDA